MKDTSKLKALFATDPEVMAMINQKESAEFLAQIALRPAKDIAKDMLMGNPGEPGVTPVKGKDYFTEEEIAKIAQDILKKAVPVKGKHYFDGKDARSQITVGIQEPTNPKKGDLWYSN